MARVVVLFAALIIPVAIVYGLWPWITAQFTGDVSGSIGAWGALIAVGVLYSGSVVRLIFGRDIFQLLNPKDQRNTEQAPPPKPDAADILTRYYTELHLVCQRLNLALIDPRFREYSETAEITLPRVYQDMEVTPWREEREASDRERDMPHFEKEHRQPLLSAAALDKHKKLLIKGDVGSGKSMFVDYLAGQIAASHLDKTPDTLPAVFRHVPVVRLRLRSIAMQLNERANDKGFLLQAMRDEIGALCSRAIDCPAWETFEKPLLQHGVILLDGLDEVPKTEGLRATLFDAVEALAGRLGGDARLIVTSRPYVFDEKEYCLPGFEDLELLPMRNEQVEGFLDHWYQLMRANRNWSVEEARKKAAALHRQLLEREYLLEPARRPLLLTLLASLHFARDVLPHSRAELYQQAIDLMLERWTQRAYHEHPDFPLEAFERKALAESAATRWGALQQVALSANREETLQVPATRIKGLFSDHLSDDCNANNLLDFVRYRSGILKPGKDDYFEFYHRSFQDYLAALALTELDDWQDEMERLLMTERGMDWWGEVFLLLVSAKIYGNSKPDAVGLLRLFIPNNVRLKDFNGQQWDLLFLAAQAVIEQKPQLQDYYRSNPRYRDVYDDLERHLSSLVEGGYELAVTMRDKAGKLLGELGDPRPGVTVLRNEKGVVLKIGNGNNTHAIPDIDWVAVPADCFLMGSTDDDKQAYDQEKPAHEVDVKPFCISRYPITNAQYACFIDAGGYDSERYWLEPRSALRWWQGKPGEPADLSLLDDNPDWKKSYAKWLSQETTRRLPWFWEQRKWNNPNHPVVGVGWYEALAFCNWLDECRRQDAIPEKRRILGRPRLPSEEEWEYAARGETGLRYAWGNEPDQSMANYRDTGLEATSTVGLFPPGRAFDESTKLYDMSGNVWEWTSSRWGTSLNQPDFTYANWESLEEDPNDPEPVELRVIRGGSWSDTPYLVRCAARGGGHPDVRGDFVGFRVVFSLAAESWSPASDS